MGTESWKNFSRLIEELQDNPTIYSFFYAIYLAEQQSRKLHPGQDAQKLADQFFYGFYFPLVCCNNWNECWLFYIFRDVFNRNTVFLSICA